MWQQNSDLRAVLCRPISFLLCVQYQLDCHIQRLGRINRRIFSVDDGQQQKHWDEHHQVVSLWVTDCLRTCNGACQNKAGWLKCNKPELNLRNTGDWKKEGKMEGRKDGEREPWRSDKKSNEGLAVRRFFFFFWTRINFWLDFRQATAKEVA